MAFYIAPIVAAVIGILQKYTPDALSGAGVPSFTGFGMLFTGTTMNPPEAWVMPVRTPIEDDEHTYAETHIITIKFSVTGTEPDQIATAAMVYMKAISDALQAAQPSDWGAVIPLHTHVFEHDYGPTFSKDGVTAKFPEAHVQVEVQEVSD
ncbi:MAG: hypothetical protein KGL39_11495 [Patescibacteria group bacterium]|nr:hypothetical protein [Patescibacteria group bacterium]